MSAGHNPYVIKVQVLFSLSVVSEQLWLFNDKVEDSNEGDFLSPN